MPYSAVILGVAGLIPFLFLPLFYVFSWLSLTQSALYFIQYSAVLLSFFGGVHWWDAMKEQAFHKQMYIAMLPTIVGWACLVFSHRVEVLGILSLCYVGILVYDKFTLSLPKTLIVDYISLRIALTTVVVLCHAWMIFILT